MSKKKKIRPEPISQERKDELEQKDLPEFREQEKTESPQPEPESPKNQDGEDGPGLDEEKIFDIEEICRDLADMPFHIWSIRNPNVPPLSEKKKDQIAKYLIKFAIKYKVAKYLKDELMLIGIVGYEVMRRLGIKKDVDDNGGKEGERED